MKKTGLFFVLMISFAFFFLFLFAGFLFLHGVPFFRSVLIGGITLIVFLAAVLLFVITVFILISSLFSKIPSSLCRPLYISLYILYPFFYITGFFLKDRNMLIRAFINFHNQITLKTISKPFSPDKILILLPHCLQKETCTTKITLNINECKECGDCIISQVKVLNNMGLTVKIAPGGTIARQMVKKYNPGLVVAVACENDLNRGIRNVLHCPVLGIINERPNGPCHQTTFSLTECLQFIRQVAASPDGA